MTKRAQNVEVHCLNTGQCLSVEFGTSLAELLESVEFEQPCRVIAARVNNAYKDLGYKIYKPITVEFFDMRHYEGYRVLQRTLSFVLQKATVELFPQDKLRIRHSLGSGFYAEFDAEKLLTDQQIDALRIKVREIIAQALPISRKKCLTSQIKAEYERYGFEDRVELLETRPQMYSTVNYLGDMPGFFYGPLAPDTSYIERFDIARYYNGLYVALPERKNPEVVNVDIKLDKMFDIFHEYQQWIDIMGVPTVGDLNRRVMEGDASELIKIAEAVHGRQFSRIADRIYQANHERGAKVVLISGPSSSGKTTSAKRIGVQLRVLGLHPVLISLDDYFVNREDTPKDENGDYDYEALEALDLARLNDDLKRLIDGQSVEIPRYDFITGTRQWHEQPLKLDDRSVLIMEGIHALNPKLTPALEERLKFKVYLSCFTSVALDNTTRIQTTDNRLLRRITRDYRTRGNNAYDTIARWPSVRRGEERHIFPYQENADIMVNTSLFYELGVLRPIVEPILREIPDTVPEYGEAHRLLHFLDNFTPISTDEIPLDSVLREFVGGSSFKY